LFFATPVARGCACCSRVCLLLAGVPVARECACCSRFCLLLAGVPVARGCACCSRVCLLLAGVPVARGCASSSPPRAPRWGLAGRKYTSDPKYISFGRAAFGSLAAKKNTSDPKYTFIHARLPWDCLRGRLFLAGASSSRGPSSSRGSSSSPPRSPVGAVWEKKYFGSEVFFIRKSGRPAFGSLAAKDTSDPKYFFHSGRAAFGLVARRKASGPKYFFHEGCLRKVATRATHRPIASR